MKKLNYQVENWFDCCEEIKPIVPTHWEEVAANQHCIPLDMDYDQYDHLAETGALRIITARDDDKLVGYYIVLVKSHLHYKSSLTAFTDMYYLMPEYRKGFNGVKLFKALEEYLESIGVQRVISSTKIKHDKGAIFKRLKWEKVESVYSKILS